MEFDVRDAVIRLQTLRDQIDLFEQVLIPQTEETLRATEAAYETAQLGVLDLLDSERMQLDVRLRDGPVLRRLPRDVGGAGTGDWHNRASNRRAVRTP